MKVTCIEPSSPFKQAVLSAEECYLLDSGKEGNIFVWKGGFLRSPAEWMSGSGCWQRYLFCLSDSKQAQRPTCRSAKKPWQRLRSSSKTRATLSILR